MPASALALVLAAAILHASWNLLLARARDPEAATAVAILVAVLAYAPVAALVWRIEPAAWPYLGATAVLHLAYTALLAAAYRRAELSVVYPVSRGTAPVLVLVVGVTALGAETSVGQALGICVVALGVFLVQGPRRRSATGFVFGLALAAVIASYTLVDKRGIPHASPFAYLEISMLLTAVAYTALLARLRGRSALTAELTPASAAAGLATFGAYGLVLAALQRAPAAPVAAVRETSIVIAAALAAAVLGETVGRLRLVGAVVVAAGVALISAS
ncbi:MAG TPA: EamA family transporter [Gaiellaceae bacterium]|jgi:drug/metabolite transporter (DMT)-like permease|nr:EamA family transporter [Gaiellaceae bacterium]